MAVEDQINELETRVAFQEETLQKLDEALADQQKQLSTLDGACYGQDDPFDVCFAFKSDPFS